MANTTSFIEGNTETSVVYFFKKIQSPTIYLLLYGKDIEQSIEYSII